MRFASSLALPFAFVIAVGCGGDDGEVGPVPAGELDASGDVGAVDPPIDADDPTPTDADDEDATSDATIDAKADASADVKPDVATDAAGATACRADLAAKGLKFKTTTARGVVDAVNVLGPINGVLFASGTGTTPMGDPIACAFVQTLWRFADLLKERGFTRVGTLGSYCYRCCCSWSETNYCRKMGDPEPVCGSSGYSNHSWGRAVDVRYLYKPDGTRYDINDPKHWVIWGVAAETCTKGLAAQTGISKELYTLACMAAQQKIFGITLSPNYNSAHRNHLHSDIGASGTPSSWYVRSLDPWAGLDDAPPGTADDHCGGEP
ncbi:MAG: extensin family protein [Deltaproteobacteria bacterium]|nr:extensin family protein [Deltaproteobacteria bacterium]